MGADSFDFSQEEMDLIETVRAIETTSCNGKIDAQGLKEALLNCPGEIAGVIQHVRGAAAKVSDVVVIRGEARLTPEDTVLIPIAVSQKLTAAIVAVERQGITLLQYATMFAGKVRGVYREQGRDHFPAVRTELTVPEIKILIESGVVQCGRLDGNTSCPPDARYVTFNTADGAVLDACLTAHGEFMIVLDGSNEDIF